MYGADHPVAGVHFIDYDPERVNIVDFAEGQVLFQHLPVNAVQVFFPADYLGRNFLLSQPAFDGVSYLVDYLLAMPPGLDDLLVQDAVTQGVERCKAQVLQFQANTVYPQALGNRGINLQGLPGDAPPLGRFQGTQGTHVVQAVGQFHHDHADIVAHGHQHLAEVVSLGFRV